MTIRALATAGVLAALVAGCIAPADDAHETGSALACSGVLHVVAPAGVRLRSAPRADAPVLATLPDATALRLDADADPVGAWVAVHTEIPTAPSGWVHEGYVKCDAPPSTSGECAALVRDYLAEERTLAGQASCATDPSTCGIDKISQYSGAVVAEHGTMACGLVASTSALPAALRDEAMRGVRGATGPVERGGYGPSAGVQPTGVGAGLAAGLRAFYGPLLVREYQRSDFSALHREVSDGNLVIVDLLESEGAGAVRVGSGPGSFAHFARVLALDPGNGRIFLENSLSGSAAVEAPLERFCDAWTLPERRADHRPSGVPLSAATRWAVVVDRRAFATAGSACASRSSGRHCGAELGAAAGLIFSCEGGVARPVDACATACTRSGGTVQCR